MHQLNEYIRYCVFEDYHLKINITFKNIADYYYDLKILTMPGLVKCCKNQCLTLIDDAKKLNQPYKSWI